MKIQKCRNCKKKNFSKLFSLGKMSFTGKFTKNFNVNIPKAFINLKEHLNFCDKCYHITEQKICEICRNPSRSDELICVVQDVRDLLAIESTQQFYGKYHVLGGVISPMEGVGPNDIKVNELKERIINEKTTEIILALPATMEGDTTNFYIYRKLQEIKVNITLISRGIGVGNQLEYIDELTLGKSLLDRSIYKTNISN